MLKCNRSSRTFFFSRSFSRLFLFSTWLFSAEFLDPDHMSVISAGSETYVAIRCYHVPVAFVRRMALSCFEDETVESWILRPGFLGIYMRNMQRRLNPSREPDYSSIVKCRHTFLCIVSYRKIICEEWLCRAWKARGSVDSDSFDFCAHGFVGI